MATYYAQKAGNINADDVWYDAASGGNLVSGATALAGTHTLRANGFSIAINVDFTAVQIDTLTAGGGFTFAGSSAGSITADIKAGTTHCLVCTHTGVGANGLSVTGDIYGGTSGGAVAQGLRQTSAGGLTVNARTSAGITGGSGSGAYGLFLNAAATISITANANGGSGYAAHGIHISSGTAVATITGTISAGTTADTSYGLAVLTAGAGVPSVTVVGTLVNSVKSSAVAGCITYNPGAGNYIEYPKTDGGAGTFKFAKTIPKADVLEGVTGNGSGAPEAGTYHAPEPSEVVDTAVFGPASATAGTYHEATVAEVQDGVMFGPASAYEGEYVGAAGGGVPLIGPGGLVS